MRRTSLTKELRCLEDTYSIIPGMKVGSGVYGIVQKALLKTDSNTVRIEKIIANSVIQANSCATLSSALKDGGDIDVTTLPDQEVTFRGNRHRSPKMTPAVTPFSSSHNSPSSSGIFYKSADLSLGLQNDISSHSQAKALRLESRSLHHENSKSAVTRSQGFEPASFLSPIAWASDKKDAGEVQSNDFQPVALTDSAVSVRSSSSQSSSSKAPNLRASFAEQFFAVKHLFPQREGKFGIVTGLQTLRELKWLRELGNHRNVTRLVDVFVTPTPPCRISLVYEFCDHDLRKLILVHRKANKGMPHRMVKSILLQILKGIAHLHNNWIVHRDLKPPNILVTTQGCVKVADFGFARSLRSPPRSLYAVEKEVVTLWYRSPELLLGTKHHNFKVDIWSIGCILGEMLNSYELFPGRPDSEAKTRSERFEASQLEKIFRTLGFDERRCGILRHLDKWDRFKNEVVSKGGFPTGSTLRQVIAAPPDSLSNSNGVRRGLMNILSGMLEPDPQRRITANEALSKESEYWDQSPHPSEDVFFNTQWQYAKVRLKTMTNEEIERLRSAQLRKGKRSISQTNGKRSMATTRKKKRRSSK